MDTIDCRKCRNFAYKRRTPGSFAPSPVCLLDPATYPEGHYWEEYPEPHRACGGLSFTPNPGAEEKAETPGPGGTEAPERWPRCPRCKRLGSQLITDGPRRFFCSACKIPLDKDENELVPIYDFEGAKRAETPAPPNPGAEEKAETPWPGGTEAPEIWPRCPHCDRLGAQIIKRGPRRFYCPSCKIPFDKDRNVLVDSPYDPKGGETPTPPKTEPTKTPFELIDLDWLAVAAECWGLGLRDGRKPGDWRGKYTLEQIKGKIMRHLRSALDPSTSNENRILHCAALACNAEILATAISEGDKNDN